MASSAKSRQHVITQRDFEILTALDRTPLTVAQLLKLSQTFKGPFTNERYLRRRMQDLAASGFVRAFQYATTGNGAPNYYRLTLTGYRLLHGPKAYPPVKRAFSEVGLSHQHHTNALADFIVHTTISAHAQRIELASFYRENTLRIRVGEDVVLPDCAFELILPSGYQFNFLVELDNGTERIRSDKDTERWDRKLRLYDAIQDQANSRFRVLIVTTRSVKRLRRIMDTAADLASNPSRRLFYGVHLPYYLKQEDAVTSRCFLDHNWRNVALIPPVNRGSNKKGLPKHPDEEALLERLRAVERLVKTAESSVPNERRGATSDSPALQSIDSRCAATFNI